MLNIFQLHISRVVAGVIIGGIAIGLFSVFYVANLFNRNPVGNYISQNDYEHDVRLLFQIAQRLGYTKENQLNFFRFQCEGFECTDDFTTLVFSTTDSLEVFSEKVDQVGLTRDTSFYKVYGKQRKDNQYILFINEYRNLSIVLTDTRSESEIGILPDDITPLITSWDFVFSPSTRREKMLRIDFAQLPKADLFWKDKLRGKTISGPIVVMGLSR